MKKGPFILMQHSVRHAPAVAVEWTDFSIPGRQKQSHCNLFTAKEISLFQCHSIMSPYSAGCLERFGDAAEGGIGDFRVNMCRRVARRFCAGSGRARVLRAAKHIKSPGANGAKALRHPRPIPSYHSHSPYINQCIYSFGVCRGWGEETECGDTIHISRTAGKYVSCPRIPLLDSVVSGMPPEAALGISGKTCATLAPYLRGYGEPQKGQFSVAVLCVLCVLCGSL